MQVLNGLGRTWGLVTLVLLAGLGGCKTSSQTGSGGATAQTLAITGSPAVAVTSGRAYDFMPTVTSAEAASYSFAVANKPHWATLNTATGELTGTPTANDVGVYPGIELRVNTSADSAALPKFSIEVQPAPATGSAPTISGKPAASVGVGTAYDFTPSAADADGDHLGFSIQNKPAWLSFNATSGKISGTPTAVDTGTYANILITVTDGTASASLPKFQITVTAASAGNGNATLSWVPPTTNTDGTALTNLSGYHIYYGNSASALNQLITITNTGLTNFVVANLSTGTWYFAVKAYNSENVESDLSPIVNKRI